MMRLFLFPIFVTLPTDTLSTVGLNVLPEGRNGLEEGPASKRSMSGGLMASEPWFWWRSSVVEVAKGENVSIAGGLDPDEANGKTISPVEGARSMPAWRTESPAWARVDSEVGGIVYEEDGCGSRKISNLLG